MPLPEIEPPYVFPAYEVEGVGTVIGHEGANYIVRMADGRVCGFRSNSGTPTEANAAADIANPAPEPVGFRRQETRIILDRLTSDEAAALTACTVPGIRLLVLKATATGSIRDDDPDFPAAVAGLDALGIIAASRWDALFAP